MSPTLCTDIVLALTEEDLKEMIYCPGITTPSFAPLPVTHSSDDGCVVELELLPLSFLHEKKKREANIAVIAKNIFNWRMDKKL